MSAKWERDSEASKGTLTFEIDVETAKKGIDQAFKRTQKRITVPGFRKGHVPRQLFNQMYGEEALYQDALNIVLPKAYEDAVKETGIEPVDQPQIDVKSLEKGQPWVLTAEVAVKPEVKLGDYKGMEVPAQDTTVSDKEVEDELESKRQQQAELVLKEDQPAENGDTVVIDYVGSVDGEKFDGGSADNYSLELGSGAFIPGFEDQLVGHKSGEDVDTLDELKEKTKKQLQEQKEDAAHAAIEDAAIEAAVNNAETEEIPQAMLDDDTDRQVQQYLMGMQQQGINPKMYFQITGTTEDDLRKQFANDAAKRVKTNLVLEAIVKDANLEATDEDIDAEIKDLAAQYGMEEDAVKKALSKDMLSHDIQIKKAVDLVTDSAKQVESKDAEEDK